MHARFLGNLLLVGTALILCGCRMGVPIYVWKPPEIASAVGKRVVLQSVNGPADIAEPLTADLLASVPRDVGRATTIVPADQLDIGSMVALASATDGEPSDLLVASAARRQQFDFVLRGEVLQQTDAPKPRKPTLPERKQRPGSEQSSDPAAHAAISDPTRLSLSWRLTGLDGQTGGGGSTVIVELDSAVKQYPELALRTDTAQILAAAAARETFRLFTPSIDRRGVQLAIPYFVPGSREVRRGNVTALQGRWSEAEQIWQDVLDTHPTQAAAAHNLALAAVARQDFSAAKELARRAIRQQPTPLHKHTLVWIELRQREYHQAFGLPDPPEGWFVTH